MKRNNMYTEGDWKVEKSPLGVYNIVADDTYISTVDRHFNAQLIASAPDLYEALLLYLDDCEMEKLEYNDDTYEATKEALAKAEGKK